MERTRTGDPHLTKIQLRVSPDPSAGAVGVAGAGRSPEWHAFPAADPVLAPLRGGKRPAGDRRQSETSQAGNTRCAGSASSPAKCLATIGAPSAKAARASRGEQP